MPVPAVDRLLDVRVQLFPLDHLRRNDDTTIPAGARAKTYMLGHGSLRSTRLNEGYDLWSLSAVSPTSSVLSPRVPLHSVSLTRSFAALSAPYR